MTERLDRLRSEIDSLDRQIISLLNQRAEIAVKVGKEKGSSGIPIHCPDRERMLLEKLCALNNGPFSDDAVVKIYREIMSCTLALEEPLKVSFLGPEGTFSHLAALKKFGSSIVAVSAGGIDEVFSKAERGLVEYGVVPVENSIEGMVSATLDLLLETSLSIVDELFLPVSLNVASRGGSLARIEKIYSHYQPTAQCHNWLSANMKGVKIVETSSTAEAAELASSEDTSAAICSDFAAEKYGLTILERSVEDNVENTTRFIVLGKLSRKRSGRDKTSLILSVDDRPGALFSILKPFASQNINLTKIESRPIKKRAWEYLFFIDFDGYKSDTEASEVINALKRESKFLKVLGSYPKVDI